MKCVALVCVCFFCTCLVVLACSVVSLVDLLEFNKMLIKNKIKYNINVRQSIATIAKLGVKPDCLRLWQEYLLSQRIQST